MKSNTLEEYFRNSKSIDHSLRVSHTSSGVSFYIHPSGTDGETMDFTVNGDFIAQVTHGKVDPQHQVLEDTFSAEQAQTYGFSRVKLEDAVIDVKISTKVRQIGATSIVSVIAKALEAAGFANVHTDSRDLELYSRNTIHPQMFDGNPEKNMAPHRNIRINVVDTYPQLRKS